MNYKKLYIFILIALIAVTAQAGKPFTLVIDAGHGGHDHGAIAGNVREKNINLAVALEFGRLVKSNLKDVNIVYTRDGDYFRTLQERAKIANKAQGDLFVSIHTNSVDKRNRNRATIQGASTYTLGLHRSEENFEVAQRENSVMMLEDDYATTYCGFDPNSSESYIMFELSHDINMDRSIGFAAEVQRQLTSTAGRVDKGVRQAGFWVLAQTSMPAVLIELDFICNPTQAKFLASDSGQKKLGKAIYNAFAAYISPLQPMDGTQQSANVANNTQGGDTTEDTTSVNDNIPVKVYIQDDLADNQTEAAETTQAAKTGSEVNTDDEVRYKIQFMTHPTRLKEGNKAFKGLQQIESYREGGLWKYTCGSYNSLDQAKKQLKQVRKSFPDAFIITVKNGVRIK